MPVIAVARGLILILTLLTQGFETRNVRNIIPIKAMAAQVIGVIGVVRVFIPSDKGLGFYERCNECTKANFSRLDKVGAATDVERPSS